MKVNSWLMLPMEVQHNLETETTSVKSLDRAAASFYFMHVCHNQGCDKGAKMWSLNLNLNHKCSEKPIRVFFNMKLHAVVAPLVIHYQSSCCLLLQPLMTLSISLSTLLKELRDASMIQISCHHRKQAKWNGNRYAIHFPPVNTPCERFVISTVFFHNMAETGDHTILSPKRNISGRKALKITTQVSLPIITVANPYN